MKPSLTFLFPSGTEAFGQIANFELFVMAPEKLVVGRASASSGEAPILQTT